MCRTRDVHSVRSSTGRAVSLTLAVVSSESSWIMFKTFATALLAVSGSMACAAPAQACHGGCGCATACAPQACATAPADPHTGMQMGQAPAGRTYQSFSYEPGVAAPAPAPIAAGRTLMTRPTRGMGRLDETYWRGDSKASGRYQWNAR